jgi:hypothetical protein
MFPALAAQKALFLPFVFKMFPALGACAVGGQKVGMKFWGN